MICGMTQIIEVVWWHYCSLLSTEFQVAHAADVQQSAFRGSASG